MPVHHPWPFSKRRKIGQRPAPSHASMIWPLLVQRSCSKFSRTSRSPSELLGPLANSSRADLLRHGRFLQHPVPIRRHRAIETKGSRCPLQCCTNLHPVPRHPVAVRWLGFRKHHRATRRGASAPSIGSEVLRNDSCNPLIVRPTRPIGRNQWPQALLSEYPRAIRQLRR